MTPDRASDVPISCYIRTLNEEARIAEVVTAARAVAAEVIVIDSLSTDATVARAEAAGARVIAQAFLGQGLQKRVGEEAALHDWLLDLDADEVVSDALAAEIHALFAASTPAHAAYAVPLVVVPPWGPAWEGFSIAWRTKLYDRRVYRMPEDRRADQLVLAARVPRLAGPLWHHGWRDLAQVVAKMNASSTRAAEFGRRKPLWALRLRVPFALPFYMLQHVVLRGRFRGGLYGVGLGIILAYGRWLRDVKQLELYRRERWEARARPHPPAESTPR